MVKAKKDQHDAEQQEQLLLKKKLSTMTSKSAQMK